MGDADVFELLAEPNRRRILELLRGGERPVGEIAGALGLAQPATSKHLRAMRDGGLVAVRIDAQRRFYRLRPEPLRELHGWLGEFRALWDRRLDALERHLDQMEDP
jgi:DNA-binding transcriptional ArsR family regulator